MLLALSIINFFFSFPFQRDTLIRYLLDELHTYETDHSDALALVPCDTNDSLMGEATLIQPASNEDLQSVYKSLTADMRGMQAEIDSLTHTISVSSVTTDGL